MTNIEFLRANSPFDFTKTCYSSERDEKKQEIYEDIDSILYNASVVDEEHGEGGRWHVNRKKVYKLEENGEVAYFAVDEDLPATEQQDGGDYEWSMYEVEPKEIKTIIYERK